MKAYGVSKHWGAWDDFVRKTDEVSANPRRKNAKRRLYKTLKTRERKNNKITV
jgi:hypothetical protein